MGLDGMCRLDLHKLAIHKDKLLNIARIGLPAGMQGAIFSISNVLIQSSVNSFGAIAMPEIQPPETWRALYIRP